MLLFFEKYNQVLTPRDEGKLGYSTLSLGYSNSAIMKYTGGYLTPLARQPYRYF